MCTAHSFLSCRYDSSGVKGQTIADFTECPTTSRDIKEYFLSILKNSAQCTIDDSASEAYNICKQGLNGVVDGPAVPVCTKIYQRFTILHDKFVEIDKGVRRVNVDNVVATIQFNFIYVFCSVSIRFINSLGVVATIFDAFTTLGILAQVWLALLSIKRSPIARM